MFTGGGARPTAVPPMRLTFIRAETSPIPVADPLTELVAWRTGASGVPPKRCASEFPSDRIWA